MTASVILIGLDACDIGRIERLVAAGRMPNLAALREAGQQGLLRGRLHHFEGMTWPRWLEGRDLSNHYFFKMWRRDSMTFAPAVDCWEPRPPFWAHLAAAGAKMAVLDVPYSSTRPHGAASYVRGWQNRVGGRASAPAKLWDEMARRFGAPAGRPERYGLQATARHAELRADGLAVAEQAGAIGSWLLGREAWDLFVVVLGAGHLAGHYLWDCSQIDCSRASARERQLCETGLDDIYAATDAALGRILGAAPAGACCMAFSPFGMKANTGWAYHFEQIVAGLGAGSGNAQSSLTLLGQLRQALSRRRLMAASRLLPPQLHSRLMHLLTSRLRDWDKTRYLALPGESVGFLRLNLVGRESRGIVTAGPEREALVAYLRAALSAARDLDTDLPVVDQITAVDDLVPESAPERDWLPDLLISWTDAISAQASRGSGLMAGVRGAGRRGYRTPRGARACITGPAGTRRPGLGSAGAPPTRCAIRSTSRPRSAAGWACRRPPTSTAKRSGACSQKRASG